MIFIPRYLTLLFCWFSIIVYGQAPDTYYDTAENLADEALKMALNEIIDNHTEFTYTSSSTDVWDILKETDRDPDNSENVVLIYSGVSVNGAQEYNSGNGWTREHVWAKSRGDFGITRGPGTDVHALRPLDNSTNSKRSNRSFNNCNNCKAVTDQWGNETGSQQDENDYSFEPRDAVKGDVARMLFYMAVRYESLDGHADLEFTESMLPQGDKQPIHGVLSVLLAWHRNDPVDAWEENRNNIIFKDYQKNRNPFIDFPVLAEHLWGTKIGLNWSKEVLSIETFKETIASIYPNPVANNLHLKGFGKNAKVAIYSTIGKMVLTTEIDTNNTVIDVSSLSGMYLIHVITSEKRTTKLIVIQ
jgi:endonuclease I